MQNYSDKKGLQIHICQNNFQSKSQNYSDKSLQSNQDFHKTSE